MTLSHGHCHFVTGSFLGGEWSNPTQRSHFRCSSGLHPRHGDLLWSNEWCDLFHWSWVYFQKKSGHPYTMPGVWKLLRPKFGTRRAVKKDKSSPDAQFCLLFTGTFTGNPIEIMEKSMVSSEKKSQNQNPLRWSSPSPGTLQATCRTSAPNGLWLGHPSRWYRCAQKNGQLKGGSYQGHRRNQRISEGFR